MKHIKPFKLYENKEEKTDVLDEEFFRKIDYYYLDEDLSESKLRELYELVEGNEYRALATFICNIQEFKNLTCPLIALINYPIIDFTKKTIRKGLTKVLKHKHVDEVEFPWAIKYLDHGNDFWRQIVLEFANNGKKLRPMLEFGLHTNQEIERCISFFREINILSFMTSTGLVPEITTIERWNEIKNIVPNKMEVKVGGILAISDIKSFLSDGVDLVATTLEFKST